MRKNLYLQILLVLLLIVLTVLTTLVIVYITNDNEEKKKSGLLDQIINVDPEEYFTDIADNASGSKLKQGFVKVIDFIFYKEKINNKTFDELKDDAKLNIIKLAFKIDNKVDSIFPGYKDTIKNTASKLYNNVKERLVKLYITITNKICTSKPSICEHAKEDFEDMKESFGIDFNLLKDIYNNGKESLSD